MSNPSDEAAPLAVAEIQQRAIAGSLWTGVNTIVYLPVAFVANAIVARTLGVEGYGELAFLTVALALALPLANLGFTASLIQAGSRSEASGRRRESDDLLRRNLGFHLAVELPILLAIAAVLTWERPWWQVLAIGGVVIFSCLFSSAALAITIENRTAAGAKIAIGVNLLVQAATVGTALVTASASAVWVVRSLVPAAALACYLLVIDRQRRRVVLQPRLPRGLGRAFWRFAFLTWVGSLVALLVFSRSEIFLLQAFDQPVALGVFALAFGLSQQLTAPADALIHPLLPAVAGVLHSFPERARATFERSTRVSSLVCGAIAAATVPPLVFAVPLIYGEAFEATAWLFIPLALVSLFQSTNNPVTAFLNARQRGGLRLKVMLVALAFDLAIAVATIPEFGAWGAVAAAAIGQLVAITLLVVTEPFARGRGLGGFIQLHGAFFVGIASAAIALSVGAALEPWSAVAAVLVAFLIGSGLYFVALRITGGWLSSGDRQALIGAMPRPLSTYVAWSLRHATSPPDVEHRPA